MIRNIIIIIYTNITKDITKTKQWGRGLDCNSKIGLYINCHIHLSTSLLFVSLFFLPSTEQSLGQLGRIEKLVDNGSAVVKVNGRRWRLDPLCLTPAPGEQLQDEEGDH